MIFTDVEIFYPLEAKCDLTICRLTETSGPVAGGKEILLFCDKINKDDVQVRFYQETNGQLVWEGFGDFQPSDVHKQYGICFRTPRYKNIEVRTERVEAECLVSKTEIILSFTD